MVWIGGFVLAVALYLIGPDRFFDACWDLFDQIDSVFRNLVVELGAQTYGVVRASAIAIYVVFVILAVLASQRGHHGFWPLIGVSVTFMVLIWRPWGFYPAPLSRWLGALALVLIAAIVMTQRLTVAPYRRNTPIPPYPPGHAP